MACQLSFLALCEETRAVKRFLFPEEAPEEAVKGGDGWDDSDWGWQDEDAEAEDEEEEDFQHSWLQECSVSLSPAAELMAIAHDNKLVLLGSRYGNGESDMHYTIVYHGIVTQEPGEFVTYVSCLPLASQKKSTQGGPDWTCVIVGFSSGYVRMFTESGAMLLSQLFSMESVQGIKCRTYEPPRHSGEAERHEELTILYRKSLVTIDGFSLVQSLRACRNQVARAAASGSDAMQAPPLAYKKWALQEQESISDHVACGVSTPNAFDQLASASMYGGYNASIRSTPPASHLYVTTGAWPFTAFFYAVEGSAQPMLSDVAHAVASKLKSALFSQISAASGWLGLGGGPSAGNEATQREKKPKIEPATALPLRFGLYDKRRQGEKLCLAPDGNLLATTDSFGRVILVDVTRGVAVRMWKGYRDAQLAFVAMTEDQPSDRSSQPPPLRRALFLIIYAPRRGILEVWTAQHGPRVAAFNVSKWSQLLCPGHGLMGLNNVTFREVRVHLHPVFLLDSDGTVRTIEVPFHLALSDKNHKRARDMHLLKKLKAALKEVEDQNALQSQVVSFLLDMRMSSTKQQGLQRVLHTGHLQPPFLLTAVQAVHQQLVQQQEKVEESVNEETTDDCIDYESRVLMQFCCTQTHLLNTFAQLTCINTNDEDKEIKVSVDQSTIEKLLGLTPPEAEDLTTTIDKFTSNLSPAQGVTFEEDDEAMSAVEFLKCFECHMLKNEDRNSSLMKVCDGISTPQRLKLARLLYGSVLERGTNSDYNHLLSDSHIEPQHLMNLLLELWLIDDFRHPSQAVPLHNVFKSITCLKEVSEVTVGSNAIPVWWQSLRDTLSLSENILAALIAALIGRTIAMEIARVAMQEAQMSSSSDSGHLDLSEWESVTLDRAAWTVLIRQLEDLLCLSCLLAQKPPPLPQDSPSKMTPDPIKVSVKKVLDGGKGMLPEFVAKWIAGHGIPPAMLCMEEEAEEAGKEEEDMETDAASPYPRKRPLRTLSCGPLVADLQWLQQRLPHSLDADVLMVNCCWEFLVLWSKDPETTLPLSLAIDYLKCIHHATLQHGVAVMVWQMFLVKKVSAAALLMEKVGKAPKDRLSRRDVGLSDVSLDKFMGHVVQLLEAIIQAVQERQEAVVVQTEDLWQAVSGPTSLVELAAEQKLSTEELLEHHLSLSVIIHAILVFNIKGVKPMSLFDAKGRSAFFKSLQSKPALSIRVADDDIMKCRQQFMLRVLTSAVQSIEEAESSSLPLSVRCPLYTHWPQMLARISRDLCIDIDELRRHQVCQLYSHGYDKMAEEVIRTVGDHAVMGSQLMLVVGRRLGHHMMNACDPDVSVERLSKCSPTVSTWLKSMDSTQLKKPDVAMQDTAALVGQVVNQLPEGHSEYPLAIELVELSQNLL